MIKWLKRKLTRSKKKSVKVQPIIEKEIYRVIQSDYDLTKALSINEIKFMDDVLEELSTLLDYVQELPSKVKDNVLNRIQNDLSPFPDKCPYSIILQEVRNMNVPQATTLINSRDMDDYIPVGVTYQKMAVSWFVDSNYSRGILIDGSKDNISFNASGGLSGLEMYLMYFDDALYHIKSYFNHAGHEIKFNLVDSGLMFFEDINNPKSDIEIVLI